MNVLGILQHWPQTLLHKLARREREVRDTLWLLGTIVWILLPHFSTLPLWCSTVVTALLLWRAYITWAGKRLPQRWLLIVLMCLTGIAIFSQYRTIFGKDAGVAFMILLLGLKLMEMRARRDIFVVIFLCLFVMLTGLFEAQTMFNAASVLLGLLLLITALISTHFIDHEPSYVIKLKLAGQLTLYALPLMAALFVLFPRVQGPLWGMPADAFASKTGLSDSMSPGSFDSLSESNAMALRAEFSGRVPAPAERYWRGPVFDFYDGRTWRNSQRWAPSSSNAAVNANIEPDVNSALDYTVTLEASNRPWLMVLEATPEAPILSGNTMGNNVARVRGDMQVVTQELVSERLRYTVRSYTRYQTGRELDPVQLQRWLELPAGFNPRTLALAAQWQNAEVKTAGEMDRNTTINRRLLARALQWIRSENFVYTLESPKLGRNAVDEFLFDTRRGFCEHYAGAFVVLMRALDIPARVVTGYQGGEINPIDGTMEVRLRDAHAWAEVWLADAGWIRVDPTAAVAPERIERGFEQTLGQTQGLAGSLLNAGGWLSTLQTRLRFNWDAVENAWNQWVLGYSTERQSSLLSGFGIEKIDWQGLTFALIAVFGGLLGLIGIQLVRQKPRVEPVVQLYMKLCDRVAKMSATQQPPRLPHEGPQAYLQRVLSSLPLPKQSRVQEAFALYEQLRYGSMRGRTQDQAQLMQHFKTGITQLDS